jgi:hypothetical protein
MINLDVNVDSCGGLRFEWTLWESSTRLVKSGFTRTPLGAARAGRRAAKAYLEQEDCAGWLYVHRRRQGETLGRVIYSHDIVPRQTRRRWRDEETRRSYSSYRSLESATRAPVRVQVPLGATVSVRGRLLGGVTVRVKR